MKASTKAFIHNLLENADITINGDAPCDIHIHNEAFYDRVLQQGALGLGEAYMDGWWECQALDQFFAQILRARITNQVKIPLSFAAKQLLVRFINFQTKLRAKVVAKKHYDLSNELFKAMLDKRMIYSCAYFKNANSLDEAQEAKLKLICDKLQLSPGLNLLDIGCGWGGLARYAAEHYGVNVVGITISQQQYLYAKSYCKDFPIDIQLLDYRDIKGKFDRIVSVGMFEHVGHLNYPTFMNVAANTLTEEGLFLLHTIGVNTSQGLPNEWIMKYIFPNGMLPSIALISKTAEPHFVVEDLHSFGNYYDPTLMAWYHNFIKNWDEFKNLLDQRFYKMWTYYLLSCAGSFRARNIQLWQIVFSKKGISGGYKSLR